MRTNWAAPHRLVAMAMACSLGALASAQITANAPSSDASQTATASGGDLHGMVMAGEPGKPGSLPLPGVTVTATNTLTGRKVVTATSPDGSWILHVPRDGRYVVRTEFMAFASESREVLIHANAPETATPTNGNAVAALKPVRSAVMNFGLQLQSRVQAAEGAAAVRGQAAAQTRSGGLQSLSLSALDASTLDANPAAGGSTESSLPGTGALPEADGADAVAVNGQMGQTNALAGVNEDDLRSRVQEAVDRARANGMLPAGADPTQAIVSAIGGMMGGGSGGGGRGGGSRGGGGGFGAFRNFNPSQPHGSLFYQGDFSALDSAQWSPTLTPVAKQGYTRNSFGASLLGSPYIPGLTKPSTKQFAFLNFSGQRNTTPRIFNGTVPTLAERGLVQNPDGTYAQTDANFAGLLQNVNGAETPVNLYYKGAQLPGGGKVLPAALISAQARRILDPVTGYYPLPNIANGVNNVYNYQTVTTAGQNSANLNARYNRNFGSSAGGFGGRGFGGGERGNRNAPATLRQSLDATFNYSHSANDLRNIFLPLGGTTRSNGYAVGAGYQIGYGRLSNHASVTWNRSHGMETNYFTGTGINPASQAGINEPAQQSLAQSGVRQGFYNGLPNLSFTNFTSITNTVPSDTIGQTISFSDFVSYRHKKNNYRFGFDLRRVHQDQLGGNNPLGTFSFSGYATQSAADQAATQSGSTVQATTGTGFADFLVGLPQQATVQAGLNKIYLREWVADWYAQDDYRVLPNLTLNAGLRYEYFGPYSEKNGRLADLTGVTALGTTVGCTTPFGATITNGGGTVSCAAGASSSLLNADHLLYSPRVGLAWKPKPLKNTVLRAGYGINFNTSQYATFARALSYQQPFALTQNNVVQSASNTTGCTTQTATTNANLTLANGFTCSTKLFQNTYAVNPNYRLGHVQVYNLDVQQTLPLGIVLNVGYNGSRGGDLDITRAPNHTSTSVTTPDAVAFTYEDSLAESRFNALVVEVRKRLQKGIGLGATYTYSHSIDNASSFGGATALSPVQNDARLDLEESNSSFDLRHQLNVNWIVEAPFGPNRAFLNKGGKLGAVLDGLTLSGNATFTSGAYFTPQYTSTAAQIAAGGTYTLRPDRVFTQPIGGSGQLGGFFNKAAFAAPVSPTGYGTASRYSIEGPGQVLVNASLGRTVRLGETRSFEARMTASNVFNTVQYSGINTTLNSATFGQVTGAATMRQIVFVGRYRF